MSFSVIVPSRNPANLRACIGAIRARGETCRVIAVDDGLTLSGIEPLQAKVYGKVEIVAAMKPFIFSRNLNIGIRAAGDDDVILLNDDCLLKTPGGFTDLARVMTEHRPGILAPACTNVGNPDQTPPRGHEKRAQLRTEPRTLCFTCVYIPRFILNVVGLLDERFVDYGMDDDDYCLRVRQAGYTLAVYDGCVMDHHTLPSSYRANGGGDYRPNMRRFIAKWGVDNWGRDRAHSEFRNLWP